jgi:hypothetical protein
MRIKKGLWIDSDVEKMLCANAERTGKSQAQIVNDAVRYYLSREARLTAIVDAAIDRMWATAQVELITIIENQNEALRLILRDELKHIIETHHNK